MLRNDLFIAYLILTLDNIVTVICTREYKKINIASFLIVFGIQLASINIIIIIIIIIIHSSIYENYGGQYG